MTQVHTSDKPDISIVVPVYQAAGFLREFYLRITKTIASITKAYEIIFVNDGSDDATPQMLEELYHQDASVTIIHLSRNFGQFAATRTGLAYARGKYIYVTDADLEEAPEWLALFYARSKETNAEIIFGQQQAISPQPFIERVGAKSMRMILKYFSDIPLVENYVSARLMTRPYLDALLKFTERTGGFYILCQLTGFPSASVNVEKRYKGFSSYTLRKKITAFIDHILSATSFPIACIGAASALLLLGAFVGFIFLLFKSSPVTSLQAVLWSVWCGVGMILAAVSIVGLYASRDSA